MKAFSYALALGIAISFSANSPETTDEGAANEAIEWITFEEAVERNKSRASKDPRRFLHRLVWLVQADGRRRLCKGRNLLVH